MVKSAKFRDPVYRANHRRLHRARGRAADQLCARCPEQAEEWAQVHTEDGSDPWSDYLPLCRSCHVNYDRGGVPGHPQSAESRAKTSAGKRGQHWSPEARQEMSATWHEKRRVGQRDTAGRWR